MIAKKTLEDFVIESWAIEGYIISGVRLEIMVELHADFLSMSLVTSEALVSASLKFTDGVGVIRTKSGMDVTVGRHTPMPGGSRVNTELDHLCLSFDYMTPFAVHQEFEKLHLFMDGNGRVGRLLWAWGMQERGLNYLELGFLHTWYYQSLDNYRD